MSVNTDVLRGPVRFTHAVIADSDDENGTTAMNSLELGQLLTFDANYTPPATVLFSLSISLTKQATLYLRFTPSVISSLKKISCNEKDDNSPPCFDTIQRLLGGDRSFTRLQFHLCSRGQLIVPIGFDPNRCDAKVRRTFALVTLLAATSTFSLYLPRDRLPNVKYQAFYRAWRMSSAPTDLRKMYNGKGGALFSTEDQDRFLSSIPGAVTTVATNPPSYDSPPNYNGLEHSSPPRASQQPTPSELESDIATIAASTPLAFRDDDEGHHAIPSDHKECCSKRGLSSDGESVSQVIRRKRQAMDDSSQSWFSFVGLDHHKAFNRIQELEVTVQEQMKEMGRLEKMIKDFKERVEVIEADKENVDNTIAEVKWKVEYDQDDMKGQLETTNANVHELGQDVEKITTHAEEYIEDLVDSRMEEYVQHKAQEAAAKFEKEFKQNLFRSLAETCSLTKSTN